MESTELEGRRQEYFALRDDLRNHSNLRFTIFAVYLAAMGGLGSIAFGLIAPEHGNPQHIKELGRFGGLVVTVLIFVYELRIQSLINRCIAEGGELEHLLGFNHFKTRPSWGIFRIQTWNRVFFAGMIFFWFIECYRVLK